MRYKNPVYPHYFADPFVWQVQGKYFAAGTGPVRPQQHVRGTDMTSYRIDGEERAFPLLVSGNLVDWELAGGALRVPDWARGGAFWAPEVGHDGEFFYLYYSVSVDGDLKQQNRVAQSRNPEGPYEDLHALIGNSQQCPFAIDPHPFRDDDGQWYLFYARDFLDYTDRIRAGTALVVDRLIEMTRLAGDERTVLRATRDWQIFEKQRQMYGRVFDWHTLEGPCVRKHNGLYYCFYSGGCFENDTYGVDYATAQNVLGPYNDAGNESGPRVFKTVPGRVLGPGHQSIVPGPDGRTEYFVYHAWDPAMTARRMCIDKLAWTSEGPRCLGPTWEPQEH